MKLSKTTMVAPHVEIEGCFFPFPDKTTLSVDADGFKLKDAVIIPMSEATRLGIVRVEHIDAASMKAISVELQPQPGSADTLQHCLGCTCKP